MNLARLGGLGAEAVDECAQVRDARLLVRLLALLLRLPLGALQLAGRISAGVADQALVFEGQRGLCDAVQEVAIMGDRDDRAWIPGQPALEPDDGVEVEVIGRFVQQEQVAGHEQRARQVQSHAPAARQRIDGLLGGQFAEAQAGQQLLDSGMRTGVAGHLERFVSVRQRHAVVGLRGEQLAARGLQRLVGSLDEAPGWGVATGHVLLQAHDPHRRRIDVAAVQRNFADQRAQQRRLPAAVRADQGDAFSGCDRHIGVFDQHASAARKADASQPDHRAAQASNASRESATIRRSPAETGT